MTDQGNWDFYEASTGQEGQRAVVRIDLGAQEHAPLKTHPLKLQIRFALQSPRPDGLRDASEADAVFALEDRIIGALEQAADAKHVATITAHGYTELVLYVPADKQAVADNLPAVAGKVDPYLPEWYVEPDAEWEKYEELFPNRYAMQSISNRRLLQQMAQHGDHGDVAREIDHFAFFPSAEQRDGATAKLKDAGFRVEDPTPRDDDRFALSFHRTNACDRGQADNFVFEIFDLLDPFDGDYDGWGSMIVASPTA